MSIIGKDFPIYHCPQCSKTYKSTFDLGVHLVLDHHVEEGSFLETSVSILVRTPKVTTRGK